MSAEIIRGMPDGMYHADSSLSSSSLKLFMRSPQHYVAGFGEDTTALRFGRLVHSLTLEPETFWQTATVVEASSRNTKIYKEAAAAAGGFAYLASEVEAATDLAVAVHRDAAARLLLKGAEFENSIFWDEQGRAARARPDAWNLADGIVVDLKTCDDASPTAFTRSIVKYGYHVSAEWYRRGVVASGNLFTGWYWIAVEKKPPHAVQVYRANREWFEYAGARIDVALRYMTECESADKWPSYVDGICNLSMPDWAS